MKILAFLTDPPTVRSILQHVGLPDRPPPLAPARGPPQAELDFDQTSGFDPTDGDFGPTSTSTSRCLKIWTPEGLKGFVPPRFPPDRLVGAQPPIPPSHPRKLIASS